MNRDGDTNNETMWGDKRGFTPGKVRLPDTPGVRRLDPLPGVSLLPDPLRLSVGIVAIIQTAPHEDHWTEAARSRELTCRRCQITIDSSVPPQQARCPTCGGPMERV